METLPNAYGKQLIEQEIAAGLHRDFVGGLWEVLGELQFNFMVRQGLLPNMRLLDIGCGCLRGGVHFIRYLQPGHYFGIDTNASLLAAGYDVELAAAGLQERMPRSNLLENSQFEVRRFNAYFDFALAQSVFTHLPAAFLRRCLDQLAGCVPSGGKFFVSYFECPTEWPQQIPRHYAPHGGTTFPDRDPFHYRVDDLRACAEGLPWSLEPLGPWGHPRSLHIAQYTRD